VVTGEQDAVGAIGTPSGAHQQAHLRANAHSRGIGFTVSTLRHAATRLADFRSPGNRFKTRDLVALLLSHGARSWRASQPTAHVRVKVFRPNGRPAVRIDLAAPDVTLR
jgi:hypothetical protein